MKELSIVKQMVADGQISQEVAEKYFPELKESEDEKIRKEIKKDAEAWYKENYEGSNPQGRSIVIGAYIDGALAWLEKQGEQNPTDKEMNTILQTEYEKGRADAIAEVQKSWSEEDEVMLETAISSINQESVMEGLKSSGISYSIDSSACLMKNLIDWLKSLKERYAWKKSLATAGLENSLCDIQDGYSDTSYEYRILGEAIEFIRCTEPQPHWKPSKEQMLALKEAEGIVGCLAITGEQIKSLYQDLKKLREE